MAVTISLTQAEEIIRYVDQKANLWKAKLLRCHLLSTAQSLALWNSLGSSGTATDRERAARRALATVKKAHKNRITLALGDVFDRNRPLYSLVIYAIAESLDSQKVQRPIHSGEAERRLAELCAREQQSLIKVLEEMRAQFRKEQQENSRRSNGRTVRQADKRMDIIYMDLMTIYEGVFGRFASISYGIDEEASGPLMRFLTACFNHFGITHQTPDGIRRRVRRLKNQRLAGHKDYDFGYKHLAQRVMANGKGHAQVAA